MIHVSVIEDKPIKVNTNTPTSYNVGSNDYNELVNKPQINSRVLAGNLSSSDIGFQTISNIDILEIYKKA